MRWQGKAIRYYLLSQITRNPWQPRSAACWRGTGIQTLAVIIEKEQLEKRVYKPSNRIPRVELE
jgi:hypothetical protein